MIAFVDQTSNTHTVTTNRPYCPNPKCNMKLTGWIAHNRTKCPGCGNVVEVKWQGNTLVVTDETYLSSHT